jgi:hypothetical protein
MYIQCMFHERELRYKYLYPSNKEKAVFILYREESQSFMRTILFMNVEQ